MKSDIQQTPYGSLPNNLNKNRLGDLCVENGVQTGPFGSQLHQEDYVPIGTPIITVEHLGDNRITHQNLPRVSNEDKVRLSKYSLKKGDIVFSRVGSVDRRAIVQENEDGWLFSGRCLRVRPERRILDPLWLSYFFGLPAFKQYIRGIAVGATMPSINTKILSDIPVYFPSLNTQQNAARILKSLDDKITLNSCINQTLELMAQALFKNWFIDYEPVKAKIATLDAGGSQEEATLAAMISISGKNIDSLTTLEHKYPKEYAELKSVAELFPTEMVECELGRIPKGWELGQLSDIATLNYGKALKKSERTEGPYAVYGSGGITGCHKDYLVSGPGVIVGRKGSIGTVYWEDNNFFPIDTTYYILSKKNTPLTYLYHLLKNLNLQNMNTDAAVPGLNRDNVYRLDVVRPPSSILECFSHYAATFRENIKNNNESNKCLMNIRDSLLPKLIFGEISLQGNQ